MCAGLFCLFTFCYIFFYQSDILALGQHVLSEGLTHFNRSVGAVLLTIALYLIHIPVRQLTQLKKRAYALNYFPSLLILTVITDVSPTIDVHFSFGAWIWVFPLLIVAFAFAARFLYLLQPYEENYVGIPFVSRPAWINVATLLVMFILTGWVSNHNDVFHYRMRMETLLEQGRFDDALKVAVYDENTDANLDFLRAVALAKKKQLGDKLFDYHLSGSSDALTFDGKNIKTLQIPDSIVKANITKGMRADMRLATHLLNRRLDLFAKNVATLYNDSTMPVYYREAMAIYRLENNITPTNSMDSVALENARIYKQYMDGMTGTPSRLENIARHSFPHTYFYYYRYHPSK